MGIWLVFGLLAFAAYFHLYVMRLDQLVTNNFSIASKNSGSDSKNEIDAESQKKTTTNVGNANIIKPTNIEFLKSNPRLYVPRNESQFRSAQVVKLYTDEENMMSVSSILWADFIQLPKEILRSKVQALDPTVLKSFKLCSPAIVANLSRNLDGKDFEWCKWSLSNTGGKVVVSQHISC